MENQRISEATLVVLTGVTGRIIRTVNGDQSVSATESKKFDLERRITQRVINSKELEGANHVIK